MTGIAFKLRVLRVMLANAYADWFSTIWRKDPDSQYCCDGRECCCGGETVRDMWTWELDTTPNSKGKP